ncbi:hypothetical protein IJJ18_01185 [Candidatus Saccharibacteria bacterium]|nr:hypothetical protein [Candidatus Saccharibacteria bacterium]
MKEIYKNHKGLFYRMLILAVLAFGLFVFSIVTLSPSSSVVKTGYSDIGSFETVSVEEAQSAGGYQDGSWLNMLSFPILAIILGVLHNLIAIKLYKRRGESMARVFVTMSAILAVLVIITLARLVAEG